MKTNLVLIIIGLLVINSIMWQQAKEARQKWETAEANVKAYASELATSDRKNTALEFTVAQLNSLKDSVLQELNQTRKELKIKDKNLKALQAVSSSFVRMDTITLKDTLFQEPSLAIDTMLGDEWYQLQLGLKYPSTIIVTPTFKSEKHIVVSNKKETINPPKKFFLFRWLQRKHIVLQVDVVEKNPYVKDESSKYIEIIK